MTEKPERNFDTGLRILEVLKILLYRDVSKTELIKEVGAKTSIENVYTLEAFIKYFNTLSVLGFDIEKNKRKYSLKNAVDTLQLKQPEVSLLIDLITYTKKLHNKNLEAQVQNIMKRTLKFMEPSAKEKVSIAINQSAQNINTNNNIINSIESMMYDGQFVCITYLKRNNVQDTLTAQIKEIIENKNNVFLLFCEKNKTRNKKINISSILEITQTPEMVSNTIFSQDEVVFRLYGRLAKSYKLKTGEKTLDFSAGYMTVLNKGEDKELLLNRLLKYGENCKIIKPQSLKDDFLALTDKILENLNGETSK